MMLFMYMLLTFALVQLGRFFPSEFQFHLPEPPKDSNTNPIHRLVSSTVSLCRQQAETEREKKMELEILGLNLTCIVASLSNSEFPPNECLLPLLSKAIGYSIVAASIIVKVPQIYIILKNKSISGLSVASFELEVVGFTIALAYCLHNNLPFSAYGELLFLLIQAIILVALIYYFSLPLGKQTLLKSAIYCAVAPTILSGQISPVLFEALYASQHAIFLFAKIPQIWENYCNKSTGELSFLTNFMNFGGCFARLFTGIQEKAPTSMVVGSILGMIMNGVLVCQIIAYNRSSIKKDKKIE